ncbi:MAG: LacI family DNA-binding transcriptional regulator [Propionicimonas sp.]|nr:LacI family DNA-binding transcriptional regulator [Propionicimonas sp.]
MAGDGAARARTGQRNPTMADVARAAGVSRPLVSIVMRGVSGASESTRRRVLQVADELGYVPDARARKLRQSRSALIGVVFRLGDPFHSDLVEDAYASCARHGYEVALSAVTGTRSDAEAALPLLKERCDALILLAPALDAGELSHLAEQVPTVVVSRKLEPASFSVVRADDRAGTELAVAHLVSLGHRRIAHLAGAGVVAADDREAGYAQAMRDAGLDAWIDIVPTGITEADAARSMASLMTRDRLPTALVTFNDRAAIGVLDIAARRGIDVPADLSVVGYDDSRPARLPYIALTTIAQNTPELMREAVALALEQIGGQPPREVVLHPSLEIRETTAPPQVDV